MKALCDEIERLFPEARIGLEACAIAPYAAVGALAEWLKTLTRADLTSDLILRLRELESWCVGSPRGETAENDLFTIWHVGFIEELFSQDVTRALLPHLLDRQALLDNPAYWHQWIDPEHYQAALREY